ncbi:MAG: transposase [Acidobacteriota bacterium]
MLWCRYRRRNAGKLIIVLQRLLHSTHRRIVLIVDHHPAHRARKARYFMSSAGARLGLICAPSCSPETHPGEPGRDDGLNPPSS